MQAIVDTVGWWNECPVWHVSQWPSKGVTSAGAAENNLTISKGAGSAANAVRTKPCGPELPAMWQAPQPGFRWLVTASAAKAAPRCEWETVPGLKNRFRSGGLPMTNNRPARQ